MSTTPTSIVSIVPAATVSGAAATLASALQGGPDNLMVELNRLAKEEIAQMKATEQAEAAAKKAAAPAKKDAPKAATKKAAPPIVVAQPEMPAAKKTVKRASAKTAAPVKLTPVMRKTKAAGTKAAPVVRKARGPSSVDRAIKILATSKNGVTPKQLKAKLGITRLYSSWDFNNLAGWAGRKLLIGETKAGLKTYRFK